MGRVLMTTLVFEAVVFALAIPGMVWASGVPASMAIPAGLAAMLLALVAAAAMRGRFGYPLGWVTQAVGIGLGFLSPWMFAMGVVFAVLWVIAFVLGRRLEAR